MKEMNVRVGQMPGQLRAVSLDETKTWTVGAVLLEAQMSADGWTIMVDGKPATVQTPVTRNQDIVLFKEVAGNR